MAPLPDPSPIPPDMLFLQPPDMSQRSLTFSRLSDPLSLENQSTAFVSLTLKPSPVPAVAKSPPLFGAGLEQLKGQRREFHEVRCHFGIFDAEQSV
ncbi:hypothetical protein F2Q69_00056586 [Brassica cretica]|uniref:Uncharacterized protein n=1 Tax=Brassica cretica TaxID=69181 RepID=A0A8S9MXT9_BRACR|nr:hypothetical protein F2Q69_00056586 [Brassica cretica]